MTVYPVPRPLSLHLLGHDHQSVNPLLSHRTRALSASQSSLASNFSKLSLKLSKVFGSMQKLHNPSSSSSGKIKQKCQNSDDCNEELPYIAFQRAHIPPLVDRREQNFSAIVQRRQHQGGKRMEKKSSPEMYNDNTRDLPDLVSHER